MRNNTGLIMVLEPDKRLAVNSINLTAA